MYEDNPGDTMSRVKKIALLSEDIASSEGKFVYMFPNHLVLRSPDDRTVQLKDGSFGVIKDRGLELFKEGDSNMGACSRRLDPSVALDAEILEGVESLLLEHPEYATDHDWKLSIVGEHQPRLPWNGYQGQSAEEAALTYHALPSEAKPSLETMMKYEIDLGSDKDQEKIDMINELHVELDRSEKVSAEGKVDLA